MIFDTYCQRLFSGMKPGHWAASTHIFDIFLIFIFFLRSLVFSRSAARSATRVPSLLC